LQVEDDVDCARLFSRRLRWSNTASFEVHHVSDLQSALARIERDAFDVLLLDLELPDGEATSTIALAAAFSRHLPIVVLTACDDRDLAKVAAGVGVQDFLLKGEQRGDHLARALLGAVYRHRWIRRLPGAPGATRAGRTRTDA
jgi:DNA-binding response OmpR family regulator